VAGDRVPWLSLRFSSNDPAEDLFQKLDDARFNLLVIGQPAPSADAIGLGDLLRVHAIPDDPANAKELARVGIAGQAFYLVRPDGHVGLAGSRLEADAVTRYLMERHIHIERDPARRCA
jgi:hypothetical protein